MQFFVRILLIVYVRFHSKGRVLTVSSSNRIKILPNFPMQSIGKQKEKKPRKVPL